MATQDPNASPLKVSEASKEKLFTYIEPFLKVGANVSDHRARCEKIEKLKESSYKSTSLGNRRDCKDCPEEPESENITVPIIGPQLSTVAAELTKIFLADDPPMQMMSAPAAQEISNQYNLLYSKYSRQFQWRRNLLLCIRDAVQYNVCAAEISWVQRVGREFSSQTSQDSTQVSTSSAFEFGEQIQHLNIYNVIWDGSVSLDKVPYEGAYVGYFRKFTRIALVQWLKNLGVTLSREQFIELQKNEGQALKDYYIPKINPVPQNDESAKSTDLDTMFSGKPKESTPTQTSTAYHIAKVLYIRIIPAEFGIYSVDSDSIAPEIYRIIIAGDEQILDIRQMTARHNMFPIVFGQIDESSIGLNTYTIAEELAPIQNAAEKLYQGDIAALRRFLSDRGVYDPSVIDSEQINNPSPTAKIPLKNSVRGSVKLSDAYFPIPFEDRAMGQRIQAANALIPFASEITSANTIMRGGFVKGNKTASEFNATMQGAGNRILQFAIFFDDQFFGPVRTILKSDTLQNQSQVSLFDPETGEFVEIDIAQLRENEVDFAIAAGLLPASQMVNTDFLQTFLQLTLSSPEFNQDYRAGDMAAYIASVQGVKYLKRFARTQEEKQQMMQQQLQMQQAQAQIESQAKSQGAPNAQS